MTLFEKLVQDIDIINHLLDEYFDIVCKTIAADKSIHLTEEEILTKESIVKELRSAIWRLSGDIKRFSAITCLSEEQRDKENRNLIDFGNGLRSSLIRLERFGDRDEELNGLAETLAEKINELTGVLANYIQRSPYKIYTLQKAIRIGKQEEKNVIKKFNL